MLVRQEIRAAVALALIAPLVLAAVPARAQQAASVQVTVKDHRFQPAEVRAPANKAIVLRVRNLDSAPMEFESVSLRVEKVIAANGEGVINLRALSPGRYEFFDDFHQETRGVLVAE
jgi:cupredoxin-like protein